MIVLGVAAAVAVGAYFFMGRVDMSDPSVRYEAAMRADAIGGKTPQETLDMFITALRAGDAQKAASYFMVADDATRGVWPEWFVMLEGKGLLGQMADDIEKNARPTKPAYEGNAQFEILNADGSVGALVVMEFNKLSGVWKLRSL